MQKTEKNGGIFSVELGSRRGSSAIDGWTDGLERGCVGCVLSKIYNKQCENEIEVYS